MFNYFYPKVSGGYQWNMLRRVADTIGLEPVGCGTVQDQTYLAFSREITPAEKLLVDAIMADNPTFPPSNTAGTTFVIRDIWNQKAAFEAALGMNYKIYYSEAVPGSGDVNQIELHFQLLTNTQRNRVLNEYSKLISVK